MAAKRKDRRGKSAPLNQSRPAATGSSPDFLDAAAAAVRLLLAMDPRRLRPAELCRLLNSTPAGEVITERRFREQRNAAGFRIGDEKTVDLFRYAAWLWAEEQARRLLRQKGDSAYAQHKERARQRNEAMSTSGRDIADWIRPPVCPDRKARALVDFQVFCEQYFTATFPLAWSQDHLRVIRRIEQAVLKGGLFAMAMPRGSGKTSLVICACIWAILNGARDFVALIGSSAEHAEEMLEAIKTELECNDLLNEDCSEVTGPIRSLEGIANRCNGQLYRGKRTHILWTATEIVLPMIEGSAASGAILKATGITGRIRGMSFKRPDGRAVRPSLVILDDPQTDESAHSPSQCAQRERILAGAVLGLAGPGRKISGIMPCTVIRGGDMADSILNRQKHPEWNGERTRMVNAFPKDEKLWEEYALIRADGFRRGDEGAAATEFYRARQAEMDAGAEVAWPARFNPDEISALQSAMNLKLRDPAAFHAEYQNEPLAERKDETELTPDQIAAKLNGLERAAVPPWATHLTMFIDVQQDLLYWLVAGWGEDFTGSVIDYGTYPEQPKSYFLLRDANPRIKDKFPSAGLEGAIYAALEVLTGFQLGRDWKRSDGALLRIERALIDANWGPSTDVVYQFCQASVHSALLLPSHGRFVGASSTPYSEYRKRPGDRVGLNWRVPNVMGKRSVRHVLFDTNYWKSFVHARLAVSLGDHGCVSLFGRGADTHRLLADHLTAEYRVATTARGRTVDEWKERPNHPDNHWLDGLVGAAVAASMQGCSLDCIAKPQTTRKNVSRPSLNDLRRRRVG